MVPTLDESFPGLVAALAEHYGRGDRPGDALEPFRAMLQTLLARSADPRKVAAALDALAEAGLLEPAALAGADVTEVADPVREARIAAPAKAAALLQRLARWLVEDHGGDAEALRDDPTMATSAIREGLVGLNGVGPATADAILLFAFGRPAYPVDRATYRVLARHGWLDPWAEYDEARDTIERRSPDDPTLLQDLSAWMERLGRDFCRASVAKCERCPLRPYLPEGGPRSE